MLSFIKNLIKTKVDTNESKITTFSIHEVAKLLSVEDSKILYWCTKLKEELGMKYTGTHMKLTENDVNNLKLVKDLIFNKNHLTDDVRKVLKTLKIS